MLDCAKCLVMGLLLGTALSAAGGSSVNLDVPFVKQEKDGCGAASIAMIIEYWQRQQGQPLKADADEIQRMLYSPQAHGIHASQLRAYLEQHGFRTFAFGGQWSDLGEQVEKGRPLIVALKPGGQNQLHYVVVAGWDQGVVLINDPAERKLLKRERSQFEREWKAAGNWALLAVPRPDAGSVRY